MNAQSKDTRNATSISRETCEYAFVICPSVFGFSPSDSALDSLVSLVSAMQGGVTALFSGCTNGYKAYCSHWQMFNTVLVQECDGKTKIALTGRTHEPCYLMTLNSTCSRGLQYEVPCIIYLSKMIDQDINGFSRALMIR